MTLVKIEVDYDYLIVLDNHFLSWIKKVPHWESIFKQLMYINNYSVRKKKQIFLLHSQSELAFPNGSQNQYIRASYRAIEDPSYLSSFGEDIITKNIIFSIDVASDKPYRCYIFTSPEKLKDYSENEHYIKTKSISVKGGDEAIKIIGRYFDQFCSAKELARMGLN